MKLHLDEAVRDWAQHRIFQSSYPRFLEGNYYLVNNHGVQSLGFTTISDFRYEYGIKSDLVPSGEKRYLLTFSEYINSGEGERTSDFFRGKLGESLMRIVLMEFMKSHSKGLGIREFDLLKWNNNPLSPSLVVAENNHYCADHISRYNVIIRNLDRDKHIRQIAEYDGVLEYEYGPNKRGLIVCEAKTGSLDYLVKGRTEGGKEKIKRKIIDPLKSLFPYHQIDYLIMATKDRIFSSSKKRIIAPSLGLLYTQLAENDVGLILHVFNDSKAKMKQIADNIVKLHNIPKNEKDVESSNGSNGKQHYVRNGNFIWFFKGRRIESIMEKTDGDTWKVIYEI